MNDTIHHDGKGRFETESFREANRCSVCQIYNATIGTRCESCDGLLKHLLKLTNQVHFLDTPSGRDWGNIAEWKKAQKENKTNK